MDCSCSLKTTDSHSIDLKGNYLCNVGRIDSRLQGTSDLSMLYNTVHTQTMPEFVVNNIG